MRSHAQDTQQLWLMEMVFQAQDPLWLWPKETVTGPAHTVAVPQGDGTTGPGHKAAMAQGEVRPCFWNRPCMGRSAGSGVRLWLSQLHTDGLPVSTPAESRQGMGQPPFFTVGLHHLWV